MPMKITEISRNLHRIEVKGNKLRIAMLSDIHWDNPKCDWKALKKDLDYCLKESIPIMINGDMFCLMQGRGDRRSNKSDIREEHNNARYLDSIVETAVDWWSDYAHLLTVVGYGNHETAIIKYQETDLLRRFVDLLNYKCSSNVKVGGYGGWLSILLTKNCSASFIIKYFHGSGGGGIVTKGAINLTRALETYENFDVFTMGHIHENSCRNDVRDTLNSNGGNMRLEQKKLHLMITGSYKEEYQDGYGGWHVERGAPVKPVGGRILELSFKQVRGDSSRSIVKHVDSYKFPI